MKHNGVVFVVQNFDANVVLFGGDFRAYQYGF